MSFGRAIHSDSLRLVHVLEEKNCKPAYLYEHLPDKFNRQVCSVRRSILFLLQERIPVIHSGHKGFLD
jgi:hypothetical protein